MITEYSFTHGDLTPYLTCVLIFKLKYSKCSSRIFRFSFLFMFVDGSNTVVRMYLLMIILVLSCTKVAKHADRNICYVVKGS